MTPPGAARRSTALAGAVAALVGLAGCASAPSVGPGDGAPGATAPAPPPNPADPWEAWNRQVFAFNDELDRAIVKPLAEGYSKFVPSPARQAVTNFFGNFADAWSAVNHLLQGKLGSALGQAMRVSTNSVLGLGGLIDIASDAGLERQTEDLGQTLGRWGAEPGPYVVLPLFGPSSLRDSIAFIPDTYVSPTFLVTGSVPGVLAVGTVNVVNRRANLLPATKMLESIALDPYVFLRDAYLQRRRNEVYDGEPPEPPEDQEDDEWADDATAAPATSSPAVPASGSAGPATAPPAQAPSQPPPAPLR